MKVSALALSVALAVVTSADGSASAAPPLLSSTLFGGPMEEAVRGVRIGADGTIYAVVESLTHVASGRGRWLETRVIHLDRLAQRVLWTVPAPERISALAIDDADALHALGTRSVFKLDPSDGRVVATSPDLGTTEAFSVEASEVAVLSGKAVIVLGTSALTEVRRVTHGIQIPAGVMLDRDGGVFVSGDSNPGTGCEPWRVPQIYHFDKAGRRDWRFYDYPGPYARLMVHLESDSQVRALFTDAQGRLWFSGKSDGYNTVFMQKHWKPKEANPFLAQACFSNTCVYPRGARSYSMVARLIGTYDEIERGTWWASFEESLRDSAVKPPEGVMPWLEKQPTCGCKDHRVVWPTSSFVAGLGFWGGSAVLYGWSDKYPPTTPDSWFGRFTDGAAYLGILDEDLTTAKFATVLPASRGEPAADVRGGRLVYAANVGAAFKPTSNALQAGFAGGPTDAVFLVTCLTDQATCDGPMPRLRAPAKPPLVKPEPPLPIFSRCTKETGTSTIVSGTLPDFGVDYSSAPAPVDGGGAPTVSPMAPRDAGTETGASTSDAGAGTGAAPPGAGSADGYGAPAMPARGADAGALGGGNGTELATEATSGCACSFGHRSGAPASLTVVPLLLAGALTRAVRRRQAVRRRTTQDSRLGGQAA